ncbi:Tripartite tricarboxylate transporter family receptor [Pigmentiphaga humi]|uniref:Tripartite tricarboxylate transporter family receptor n=1 Tax=Pigmentiphaga humi TaxID=2478468 RepID=A0A3P4B432_9BURK|nr:tripartite tricarboxylate transporter substrate binding protein [Pigmentiphaga humi]VCU71054.1 Tripartite tricarboxylate transporter family receptor [Pigmentiphaga humi]
MKITQLGHALVAVLGFTVGAAAAAQGFPTKAVRLVIPFPPGGSTDVGARVVAAKMSEDLKQTVFVENRPGAGTTIGAAFVASSAPDGHTLYMTGPISHASSAALYKNLSYDALRSFASIGLVNTSPFVIAVNAKSPFKTLKDLIDNARANPGKLTYGSSGNGATPHLATELISRAAGVSFTHVPYKGAGPAIVALMAGDVDFTIADVGIVPQLREGRLRALALTTAKEARLVPGVPSLAEAGVPELAGIDIPSAQAMLAPAGTPPEVVGRLNAALNVALNDPEVRQKFAAQGLEAAPGTPDVLEAFLASEVQRYGKIVRDLGIRID